MTGTSGGADGTRLPSTLWRQTFQRRRAAMDNLRRLAEQLDAAAALDRRADETQNPSLAALLRERAEQRRRIADVVREHLAEHDRRTATGGSTAHLSLCETQPIPVITDR